MMGHIKVLGRVDGVADRGLEVVIPGGESPAGGPHLGTSVHGHLGPPSPVHGAGLTSWMGTRVMDWWRPLAGGSGRYTVPCSSLMGAARKADSSSSSLPICSLTEAATKCCGSWSAKVRGGRGPGARCWWPGAIPRGGPAPTWWRVGLEAASSALCWEAGWESGWVAGWEVGKKVEWEAGLGAG